MAHAEAIDMGRKDNRMNDAFDASNKQNDSPSLRGRKTSAKHGQRFGSWTFDAERIVLAFQHPRHNWATEIDLERTNTPAALLGAIFQTVGGRPDWVFTARDKADLLIALEEILDPQATLCSWGKAKRLDTARYFGDVQAEAAGTLDGKRKAGSPVGRWFHSHNEDGSLNWQGQIIGRSKNRVRVRLYGWLTGYTTKEVSVPLTEVEGWTLYDTSAEMREAGDAYWAKQR